MIMDMHVQATSISARMCNVQLLSRAIKIGQGPQMAPGAAFGHS